MKILIIGAGEVGFNIAKRLADEHHDVTLIEKSKDKIRRVEESLDVQVIEGSGTSPDVLKAARIEESSIIIAATDSDEVNIITCLLAKNINSNIIKIARIRNEEYIRDIHIKDIISIDHIIDPTKEMVNNIVSIMEHPWATEVIDLLGGRLKLIAIPSETAKELKGVKLRDFGPKKKSILVGAILRKNQIIIPRGDDIIKEGDLIYFISLPGSGNDLNRLLETKISHTKRVMLAGAGQVGIALARALDKKIFSTKIIEKDHDKCRLLSEQLEKVMVINGDATDKELLLEEDIQEMDFVVALTEDEENNILFSLLAKALGARKAITRINRLTYLPLVSSIGIDTVVSARLSAVKAILSFIRKGKILSVTPIGSENAEVIEVEALANTPIVGNPLKNITFPKGALVGAIVRADKVIIPSGDTVVEPLDKLVILAMEKSIPKVESLITR